MGNKLIFLAIFLLSAGIMTTQAEASSVDIGISIGEEGLRGFSLAVGEYYRVPERDNSH